MATKLCCYNKFCECRFRNKKNVISRLLKIKTAVKQQSFKGKKSDDNTLKYPFSGQNQNKKKNKYPHDVTPNNRKRRKPY